MKVINMKGRKGERVKERMGEGEMGRMRENRAANWMGLVEYFPAFS